MNDRPVGTKKASTHGRIVSEAAKLLRKKGLGGASVDEVMEAAELTRGGFYAHFSDKNALIAEALEHAFAEARKALFTPENAAQAHGRGWIEFASARYVSEEHALEPAMRCPIPPLAGEISRADDLVKAVFTKNIRENIALAEKLSGVRGKHARAMVIRMLSSWLGALTVARAVNDRELAAEILEAVRLDSLRDWDARMEPKTRPQRAQRKSRKVVSAQKR